VKTAVRVKLERPSNFAGGYAFGKSGPYERVLGKVYFSLDPADISNKTVVDLEYAPRNSQGLVEFTADLDILKPVDLTRGNRCILYDVNNRGNKTVLRAFNDAPRVTNPTTLEHAGNGFLMRQGYTIVWSGWQGDLVPGNGLLTVELPEARKDNQPLEGVVRQEFVVDEPDVLCMPLSGSKVIHSYEVIDSNGATLTVRERECDERVPLPRSEWDFAEATMDPASGIRKVSPSNACLYINRGFRPGSIYELIYRTRGSRVMGLGIIGIRDLLSYLRHDEKDSLGQLNPLNGFVNHVYGYGGSLSARVIRQFIYDGLNVDTTNRKIFDAVYVHVSGAGRLFANSRFAQVGRFPRQHEEHQWPSERYPFAYSGVPDRFFDNLDSILKRPETDPLIVHTHTSTEYWQRHASLGHTDTRTSEDLDIPETVRMYSLASAQHGGAALTEGSISQQAPNLMATSPFMRALLASMDNWVRTGNPPPTGRLPKRSNKTLAEAQEVLATFPKIPGVSVPSSPSRLPLYDYGPNFDRGIVTEHPPKVVENQEYPVMVPQVDTDGNEIAGLRSPEIEVPIGTHTGWSIRKRGFAEGELYSLTGSFIPFPRTNKEREVNGDPRASIEERYGSHQQYVAAIASATRSLVAQRLLLQEDAERYVNAAERRSPFDPSVSLEPLKL
jgi:hypothetical protein